MHAYLFSDLFLFILFEFFIQSKKISTVRMLSVINELPVIYSHTVPAKDKLYPKNNVPDNEDENCLHLLTEVSESSPYLIYGNGRSLTPAPPP